MTGIRSHLPICHRASIDFSFGRRKRTGAGGRNWLDDSVTLSLVIRRAMIAAMIHVPLFRRSARAVWRASWLSFITVLTLALPCFGHDLPSAFLKTPYLQAPGSNTMTVMWESGMYASGIVRFGEGRQLDQILRQERPTPLLAVTNYAVTNIVWQFKTNQADVAFASHELELKTNLVTVHVTNVVYLHEVTLTNLRPNTIYSYAVEMPGASSARKKFRTLGPYSDQVRFIAYGDTRTNPKIHASLTSKFKRYSPEFILHMGDLVADGRRYDLWQKEFFGPLANVIDEVPILPVIGNHEEDGTNYLRYVHLPGPERWYSYDIGPVHVLALDYHFEKSTAEQFAFAQQDLLSSKAPWKIVMLHYPVFNVGGHGTGWGHTNYLPLFHQARVDLVIGGHSHVYERFRPIADATGTNTWPITHITTGGGGAPLASVYAHPALAVYAATNHFIVIDATRTTLKAAAITAKNEVYDSFELTKVGGTYPDSYRAGIYPEGAMKLFYEAPANLLGLAAALPDTNTWTQVTFKIAPLPQVPSPVAMEIDLAPGSIDAYELESKPLRVMTPSLTESNRLVSVFVRATGKKKIATEGKEKELTPSLAFRARLLTGNVESWASGPRCKLTPPVAPVKAVAKSK